MKAFDGLIARLRALPRAARWALGAAALIAVYFAIVEPTLDATNQLNNKSDVLLSGLRQERDLLVNDSAKGRVVADGQRYFGEPLLPTDPANRAEAIHNVVDEVLNKRGVTKKTLTERQIPMRPEEAAALSGKPDAIGDRLILDITFEASPEAIMDIVSDLEQAREVAAVSRVEIRRADTGRDKGAAPVGRVLKVTISPESWFISKPAAVAASNGGPR
jgi:hypothetical protein